MTLNVEKREKNGIKTLREGGKIPAVFYGRKEESTPISVLEKDFQKVWGEAGESTIISLHGASRDIDAIIHDVQIHPVTDRPLHIDFYVIEKDRKLTVDVPLEFIGEAPATLSAKITLFLFFVFENHSPINWLVLPLVSGFIGTA